MWSLAVSRVTLQLSTLEESAAISWESMCQCWSFAAGHAYLSLSSPNLLLESAFLFYWRPIWNKLEVHWVFIPKLTWNWVFWAAKCPISSFAVSAFFSKSFPSWPTQPPLLFALVRDIIVMAQSDQCFAATCSQFICFHSPLSRQLSSSHFVYCHQAWSLSVLSIWIQRL